jgi:apolipoprotein N-acyltransferase
MERIAGGIVLLCGWRRALAAFLSGAFAVLAQAPFDFLAACFISFPVLVWLIDGATPGEESGRLRRLLPAFATGWWFGLGYFAAGLWWVGNALLVDADGFAWAIPIAVLMLPAYLALFHGLAAALARLFWGHDLGRIAALAAGFGLAEWLRGLLFTGFPWNAIGYAAMPVPLLMQPVAAIGLDAMNALAVFVFAMPALAVSRTEAGKGALLAAAIAATGLGYGYWRLALPAPGGEALAVRVVQASIDQAGKWDRELRDEIFRRHLELSAPGEAGSGEGVPQLILWPETAVPFLFSDRPDALLAIGDLLEEGQTLLAGAVRTEGDERTQGGRRYYNSIVAIDHQGEIVAAADKVHLVPFGEYLPFATVLESLGLRRLASGPGVFSAAPERALITIEPGLSLLPLICYEIIFPAEVAGAGARGRDGPATDSRRQQRDFRRGRFARPSHRRPRAQPDWQY